MIKNLNLRDSVNITLPLIAIGVILLDLSTTCEEACALSGSILGTDLRYVGIAFMSSILAVRFLKQDYLYVLFATGLGVELYLTGFQILNHTYCPYCLIVAAIILSLFVINFKINKAIPILLFTASGFTLFLITADLNIILSCSFVPIK